MTRSSLFLSENAILKAMKYMRNSFRPQEFVILLCITLLSGCSASRQNESTAGDQKTVDVADANSNNERTAIGTVFSPFKFLKNDDLDDVYRAFGELSLKIQQLEEDSFRIKNRLAVLELRVPKNKKNKKRSTAKSSKKNSEGEAGAITLDKALRLLSKGRKLIEKKSFKEATLYFKQFIKDYSQDARVDVAFYNLALCYFSLENHNAAIAEFKTLMIKFPSSSLMPATLLNLGRSYRVVDQRRFAQKTYKKLVDDFPTTEEAKAAKEELAKLELSL